MWTVLTLDKFCENELNDKHSLGLLRLLGTRRPTSFPCSITVSDQTLPITRRISPSLPEVRFFCHISMQQVLLGLIIIWHVFWPRRKSGSRIEILFEHEVSKGLRRPRLARRRSRQSLPPNRPRHDETAQTRRNQRCRLHFPVPGGVHGTGEERESAREWGLCR